MEKRLPPPGLEKPRARAGRLGDASKNPQPGDPQRLPRPAMTPPDTGRRGLCEESGQRSQALGGTLPRGNLLSCPFPTLEKGHALKEDGAPGLRKGRQAVREAGGKCDLESAPTSWVGSWPHHPQMGAFHQWLLPASPSLGQVGSSALGEGQRRGRICCRPNACRSPCVFSFNPPGHLGGKL